MAKPSEKLAVSLELLKELQDKGTVAIRASDIPRVHRERLCRNGYLQKVMKGWYIPAKPDETGGETTSWFTSFWDFCAAYLRERFDTNWCLSPEQSVLLHTGNRRVPQQLLVRSPKGRNKPTTLPHGTSLLELRSAMPDLKDIKQTDGLRIYALPAALVACSPRFFQHNKIDARAALAMIRDASEVLAPLLDGGHSVIAGRLAGAFRNIGENRIADTILETMRAADYTVNETDPFDAPAPTLIISRERSPYVNRIRQMWHQMRKPIIERFPDSPGRPNDIEAYLQSIDEIFVTDAYHSLSIEGYRVSPELIERVRVGDWNPDGDEDDRDRINVLASYGYRNAFTAVKQSVRRVLNGENPGTVADEDHGSWYRELFAPSVTAGILEPADLAGYRNRPVIIRLSRHAPPSHEAIRDCMPAFFELLREEQESSVRVVLGHFIFVYLHPYVDGNGRMGRFLMNVMLAAGGFPWTVIPVQQRTEYMASLEEASVGDNIVPFRDFLGGVIEQRLMKRSSESLSS